MRMLLLLLLAFPALAYDDPWFDNQMNQRREDRRHAETLQAIRGVGVPASGGVVYVAPQPTPAIQRTAEWDAASLCAHYYRTQEAMYACGLRALKAAAAP